MYRWLAALSVAFLLAGCGRPDPERQAQEHLRRAGQLYVGVIPGTPQAPELLAHLGSAAELSSDPRYLLALAVARYEMDRQAAIGAPGAAPPPAPGAAGEPDFQEVLRRDANCAAAHFHLGLIAQDRGDPRAAEHFRAAAKADARNALPLYLVAALQARAGRPKDALAALREGNARPECRLYVSPALEASGARPLGYASAVDFALPSSLRDLGRSLAGSPPRRGVTPRPPSYAQRLLQAGRANEAVAVCEDVWRMGRKVSASEPLSLLRGMVGSAIRSVALSQMEICYWTPRDQKGLARVAARRRAEDRLKQFSKAQTQQLGSPGAITGVLFWQWAQRWLLPSLVGLFGLGIGLAALLLRRRSPRVALGAGLAACLILALAVRVGLGAHTLPSALHEDPETKIMRQYVRMLP